MFFCDFLGPQRLYQRIEGRRLVHTSYLTGFEKDVVSGGKARAPDTLRRYGLPEQMDLERYQKNFGFPLAKPGLKSVMIPKGQTQQFASIAHPIGSLGLTRLCLASSNARSTRFVAFIDGSAGWDTSIRRFLEGLFQKSGKPDLTSAAGCPEVFKVGGNSQQVIDSFKYAQDEGTFSQAVGWRT
jgi:hypothetical protein